MTAGEPGARRPLSPASAPIVLAFLCLALLFAASCGDKGGPDEHAAAARAQYQQIRTRVAGLEEFFPRMEERLGREQGETLARSVRTLVEEGRRSYDAFLKSAAAARAEFEEFQASGGKNEEYARGLLALLDANQAEAMLVAEAMLQVEELLRQLPLEAPSGFPLFMQTLDRLAAGILESRETIRGMEAAAEELYKNL